MKMMNAKYRGKCRACGGGITVGARIGYDRSIGALHEGCIGGRSAAKIVEDEDNDRQIAASERYIANRLDAEDEREYQAGIADAERYRYNRAIYGDEMADAIDIADELRRGSDY